MAGEIFHRWEGTKLIVTSDSGTSGCDLKGVQGDIGVRGPQGVPGIGIQGVDGVGISKIEKTGSSGLVDKYTITLTDGSSYDFSVTNGSGVGEGESGKTPQLRINSTTNFWEVSYDDGFNYVSLGVKATGEDGKTPQKGVDYFTTADKAEIVSLVIAEFTNANGEVF